MEPGSADWFIHNKQLMSASHIPLDILRRISILILLQVLIFPRGCDANAFFGQLTERLNFTRRLAEAPEAFSADSLDAFYVLGGSQDDLKLKIKEVGRLYAEGKARKVFFLHRPGITEYAPELSRNYTNDEWAAKYLKLEGINALDLEFIVVPPAFFSTFAEARAVSSVVRARGFRRLILITSRHHTARTWCSFSHCNRDNRLDLYIYGTEAKLDTTELLMELLKLSTYRLIVFPLDRLKARF